MTISSVVPSSVDTLIAVPALSGEPVVCLESNVATGLLKSRILLSQTGTSEGILSSFSDKSEVIVPCNPCGP